MLTSFYLLSLEFCNLSAISVGNSCCIGLDFAAGEFIAVGPIRFESAGLLSGSCLPASIGETGLLTAK